LIFQELVEDDFASSIAIAQMPSRCQCRQPCNLYRRTAAQPLLFGYAAIVSNLSELDVASATMGASPDGLVEMAINAKPCIFRGFGNRLPRRSVGAAAA
jgi:hypothetical protein